MWALIFTFVGMFLFSLVWSASWWPPAPQTMTGQINPAALQLGFANAQTLQDKLGIPAVVFGLIQTAFLFALYRGILRRERAQHVEHEKHQKEHQKNKPASAAAVHS